MPVREVTRNERGAGADVPDGFYKRNVANIELALRVNL